MRITGGVAMRSRCRLFVYGAGYLGTVLSACLADFGTPIVCCDSAEDKILQPDAGAHRLLRKEPGRDHPAQCAGRKTDLLNRNRGTGRAFAGDLSRAGRSERDRSDCAEAGAGRTPRNAAADLHSHAGGYGNANRAKAMRAGLRPAGGGASALAHRGLRRGGLQLAGPAVCSGPATHRR